MQGNAGVLTLLNDLLELELTAVHQYLLHAEVLGNWGYGRLHHKISDEVNDELGHARKITERILFLEGTPNVQKLGTVDPGTTAEEMFRLDLDVERTASDALNRAIEQCRSAGDNGRSRSSSTCCRTPRSTSTGSSRSSSSSSRSACRTTCQSS